MKFIQLAHYGWHVETATQILYHKALIIVQMLKRIFNTAVGVGLMTIFLCHHSVCVSMSVSLCTCDWVQACLSRVCAYFTSFSFEFELVAQWQQGARHHAI